LVVVVTFRVSVGQTQQVTPQVAPQVTPQVEAILKAAASPLTRGELQAVANLKDREHFRKFSLEPLLAVGWLAITIPDRPTSRLQRYRTTPEGQRALEEQRACGARDNETFAPVAALSPLTWTEWSRARNTLGGRRNCSWRSRRSQRGSLRLSGRGITGSNP